MLVAGFEVQRFLPRNEIEDVAFGYDIVFAPPRHLKQRPLIAQPAGVMDEIPDGDSLAEVGDLGHVLANVIVERELALLCKHNDSHGSELFGYRRDVEDR